MTYNKVINELKRKTNKFSNVTIPSVSSIGKMGESTLSLDDSLGLRIREVDGAPKVANVKSIIVSNSTLTDNGNGEVTLTTGGGGGGGDVATDTIWDAKGDLAVGTGADTAAVLTVGNNFDSLIADSGSATGLAWGTKGVAKTADETVNNSSVMQDDDHIFFDVAANAVYSFMLVFRIDGFSTSDIDIAFTVPSGTVMVGNQTSEAVGLTETDMTVSKQIGLSSTFNNLLRINGMIITDTTAGTVQLQWAQTLAEANNTILKKGSYILVNRLA